MFDLTGKSALITGASGGIGAAVAKALHGAGGTVALHGTRAERLEALAGELGQRAHVTPADLSDRAAAEGLAKQAAEAMGGLDILVNNAGLTRDNLFLRMSAEEWDSVLQVNLTAAFLLSKAVLRPMMKARWGRIVMVSSVGAYIGAPGQSNYASSKAGLIGLARSIAREYGPRGITANVVAPGPIATDMLDALPDDKRAALGAQVPVGRVGTVDEVAAAVTFLASDPAAYITGAVLPVDGGLGMGF
jgi:3-oxoacyl-[acyl-carrier protein] reductase